VHSAAILGIAELLPTCYEALMEGNSLIPVTTTKSSQSPARRDSDVISTSEACLILGVHRNTLYKLLETEELPAFRLSKGGRWRFRRSELQGWLEDKEAKRRL
jgi:excisionase family DNA binding protein